MTVVVMSSSHATTSYTDKGKLGTFLGYIRIISIAVGLEGRLEANENIF